MMDIYGVGGMGFEVTEEEGGNSSSGGPYVNLTFNLGDLEQAVAYEAVHFAPNYLMVLDTFSTYLETLYMRETDRHGVHPTTGKEMTREEQQLVGTISDAFYEALSEAGVSL